MPADAPNPAFAPGSTQMAPPVGPTAGVSLSPSQVIAPIGSEVVMIASVPGGQGFLLTNERVEWTIAPGSVGQFISPGVRRRLDLLNWVRGLPRKIDSQYAVNATLFQPMTVDRGTPTPYDDILVQGGQAWVSVSSATEGTSRVTAFVPGVSGWDRRQQTASIYWVDAQWRLPPPAITPAGGRNTLTTFLTRQSDNSALAGWQVRYEIVGGPEAGFSPDGGTSVQIVTDGAGQATAEIFQRQPMPGTNQVNIQFIRPPGPDGQNQSLPVGAGSMLQTWAATTAPGATLETGPPVLGAPPVVAPPIVTAPPPATTPPSTPTPAVTPAPAAQAALDLAVTGSDIGDGGRQCAIPD